MSETVGASDGTQLPLGSLPQAMAYSGSLLQTVTVVYASRRTGITTTYVQTFTYSGTNVTNISEFIAQ